MQYRDFITSSLEEAAKMALVQFGKVSGVTKPKDNNQVLTETDLVIGKFLIDRLQKEFPTHNIINEETRLINKKSPFTWIVDPIDGTSNFAVGVPTYGIMIGLLEDNLPIAGGIILPSFNELYYASRGQGAYLNGVQIHVSEETDLSKTLIAYGLDGNQGHPEETRKEGRFLAEISLRARNVRSSNSCFDAMMVARGGYGAWMTLTMKIWDSVPIHIIAQEAGARVTGFYGEELSYENHLTTYTQNRSICVASPAIHKEVMKIIKKY